MFVESKLIKTVVLRVVFEVFSLSHCLRSHGSSKENTKKRLETDLFRYQAQMHTKKLEKTLVLDGTRSLDCWLGAPSEHFQTLPMGSISA